MVIGLALAVMGTGFALAMPIAMKTWTEAAERSEAVERVDAAKLQVDDLADPFKVPEPPLAPPTGPGRRQADGSSVRPPASVPRADGTVEQPDALRAPEDPRAPQDQSAQESPEEKPTDDAPTNDDRPLDPSPPEGKREEGEEEQEPPVEPEDDDGTHGSGSTGRAVGRDEEQEPSEKPEKDEDDEGSHPGSEHGSGNSRGSGQGTKH